MGLTQEIKNLWLRPRLLLQYVVLSFLLVAAGSFAVTYSKKEAVVEFHQAQSEKVLDVSEKLIALDLPKPVEKDVKELKESATVQIEGASNSQVSPASNPKAKGSLDN